MNYARFFGRIGLRPTWSLARAKSAAPLLAAIFAFSLAFSAAPAVARGGAGSLAASAPSITAYYEGRASAADTGDSVTRHGVFNILWFDLLKRSASSAEIFLRGKALNFEGDTFIKQYNSLPEPNGLSLNEAYFEKKAAGGRFKFGLFHFEKCGPRLFDARDFVNGFDPVNPQALRKGQGNVMCAREFANGATAFFDYMFDVDYPNSLKIAGASFGGLEVLYAANESRKTAYADYEKAVNPKLGAHANYRRTEFSLLSPYHQVSAGLTFRPDALRPPGDGRFRKELSFDIMSNSSDDGYFIVRRNIADIMAAGVLFPYQKAVYAAGLSLVKDRGRLSEAFVKYYAAASPLFDAASSGGAEIPAMAAFYPGIRARFEDFSLEASFLRVLKNDGSGAFQGKSQARVSLIYPF